MSSTNPTTPGLASQRKPSNSRHRTVPPEPSTSPPPVRLANPIINPSVSYAPNTATGFIISPSRTPSSVQNVTSTSGVHNVTSRQPRPIEPMVLTIPCYIEPRREQSGKCCETYYDIFDFCCVLGPPLPKDPRLIPRH